MSEQRDLRAAAAAAAILAALALVVPLGWLSLLLLAPLAFFLTGYALSAAIFVAARPDPARALWIDLGLSLAVLALLPLPLNYLGGLTPAAWALALVLVVFIGCAIAAARRPQGWSDPWLESARVLRPRAAAVVLGLGALVLVAGALVLAYVPLSNSKAVGFSELWLRPVDSAAGSAVRIGVGSEEQAATAYRLQVRFGGSAPVVRSLRLKPGETTVVQLDAEPQPRVGRPILVSAGLFRRGERERPYRHVYTWLTAAAGG
jgi:uncharacterized membrane protein